MYFSLFLTELLGDILKQRPKEADGIDSVIVVDNIPVVGSERQEKLQNVVRKIFSKFGKIVTEHYPIEEGKTKGYVHPCSLLHFDNLTRFMHTYPSTKYYSIV